MRRALVLFFGLLVAQAGLATTVVGSCANMPCCFRAPSGDASAMNAPDCCTSVNCSETQPQNLVSVEKLKPLTNAADLPQLFRAGKEQPLLSTMSARAESPPKTVQQRLAQLSILHI